MKTIPLINRTVARHYGVSPSDIPARIRTEPIATARKVAMYLAHELTSYNNAELGRQFGGRNESTVRNARSDIEFCVRVYPKTAREVAAIKEELETA